MKFLYALINFLLLLGIVWLIFGKTIVRMFRSRREKINAELDEAEAILSGAAAEPAAEEPVREASAEEKTVEENAGEEPEAEPSVPDARDEKTETNEKIEKIERRTDKEILDLRREVTVGERDALIGRLRTRVTDLLSSGEYDDVLAGRLPGQIDQILERIRLTGGDMAYLKTHDVLYVTLTSAHPLPAELVEKVEKRTEALLASVGGKQSFWVREDPSFIGGVRLRIGDTVYDCTVSDRIYTAGRELEKRPVTGSESAGELLGDLLEGINGTGFGVDVYQLGRVISVSDGICWMDGLADIMYGEVVEFACGERGMVLDIQPDRIGCVIYGGYQKIEAGTRVRRVGRIADVYVGEELLGRVVDPLGHPLDGKGHVFSAKRRPIECPAPSITDRVPVSRPMHTGLKAIDSMVPIGRGQRELIVGDRQIGKTSIIIDTILNQKDQNVPCIYVAIGQKDTTVAEIYERLTAQGAMEYTTIVCAPAASSASLQYIAPFAGAAIGEYFMYAGRDALIIYDDLSKHAVAYRELSLLLHRPSGREAYPGDVFYLHSRLLERAAQLSPELGGGSLTALPVIETQAGDISAYIPTNAISITDGQIFLDADLFNEGQRPAVNVGLSVSRVGGSAQTKLMKQVSSRLRMDLAQYRELANFAQFGSDIDEETKRVLASGERMMRALRQERNGPLPDWKQALIIFAASDPSSEVIPAERMAEYETALYAAVERERPDVAALLRTGKKLDADGMRLLRDFLAGFAAAFASAGTEPAEAV